MDFCSLPFELLQEIITHVKGDFISLTSTCKTLNTFNTQKEKLARVSAFSSLIMEFRNTHLNFTELSASFLLDIKAVEFTLDKPWDFHFLSANRTLNIRFVMTLPERAWNWTLLSANPALISAVDEYPFLPWEKAGLASNPKVNLDMFVADASFPGIFSNPSVSIEWLEENIPPMDWDFKELSKNPNLAPEDYFYNQKCNWDREELILNPRFMIACDEREPGIAFELRSDIHFDTPVFEQLNRWTRERIDVSLFGRRELFEYYANAYGDFYTRKRIQKRFSGEDWFYPTKNEFWNAKVSYEDLRTVGNKGLSEFLHEFLQL